MIRSKQFDDVYFSADGGMAETQYVFLDANNLPEAWSGGESFTIAETGFGTGLNFLCAWKLFEETRQAGQKLHFISVEKYPLSKDEITDALKGWGAELSPYMDRFLSMYPLRVPGPHFIRMNDYVSLTLWIGDIVDVLPQWQGGQVDAWFLDGFTPSKNPDMWCDILYESMARLSHDQTTYATFTAAGHVRRGLESHGFSVEKCKGFGRKRDMIKGQFVNGVPKQSYTRPKTIGIVGGGLAGCAMAYSAKRAGMVPVIYEKGKSLAVGASGGRLGMVNPKLTAKPTAHSDYYTMAYAHALRVLPQFDDIDFQQCGSRHLCLDEDKDRRFRGYIDNLGWHGDHIKRDDKDLYYPDAACVSPQKLCHALTQDIDVCFNQDVNSKDHPVWGCDVVVLANGFHANQLLNDDLPIHSVRGQVSWIAENEILPIDSNLCFGGYMTPKTSDGFHVLGSTFQPWSDSVDVNDDDHVDNLDRLNASTGYKLSNKDVVGGWAALRTSSKDRFPMIGQLDQKTYISTAHGSHGIISSLMAGEVIVNALSQEMQIMSLDVCNALLPKRFDKR